MLDLTNRFHLGMDPREPKLKIITPDEYWGSDKKRSEMFGQPDDVG